MLEQLHFTHELTSTLTSASEVKLNIEAILAGYCYSSALSHSDYILFLFRSLHRTGNVWISAPKRRGETEGTFHIRIQA